MPAASSLPPSGEIERFRLGRLRPPRVIMSGKGIVCFMCGTQRKKFPSSWTQNDCLAYCGSCWEKVKCGTCGHSDPKGGAFRGRWECRACRHRMKTTAEQGSTLEAFHRLIIEDQNGETPDHPAANDQEADCKPHLSSAGTATPEEGSDDWEVEEDEGEEEFDDVAPLRSPGRQSATGRASALSEEPCHIILLLDASGSMRTADIEGQEGLCRLDAAAKCAAGFAAAHNKLRPQDVFSLATFAEKTEVHAKAVDSRLVAEALADLPGRGAKGTFFRPALETSSKLLDLRPGYKSHVLLLSDGRPADTKAALEFFQEHFVGGAYNWAHVHGIAFGSTVESFAVLQQLACLSGGTFTLSSCNVASLYAAFSSVSSTITSMSSGSGSIALIGDDGELEKTPKKRAPRRALFELPEVGIFGRKGVLRFQATRASFRYDGTSFHTEDWPRSEVARRVQPYMRGGMRLVYGFLDPQVCAEQSGWMVAKCSRYLDEVLNSRKVVEAHAKSTAVARYLAARFNERLRGVDASKNREQRAPTVFFVPCFVYEMEKPVHNEEPVFFAAERYLPGAFLKYNSNNGFVAENEKVMRHHEPVQAFLHFSLEATGGQMLVADLQGVAREAEVLLTDPQVLSPSQQFGPGDIGSAGIRACLAAHRCGPTCRKLGLRPVTTQLLRRFAGSGPETRSRHGPSSRSAGRAASSASSAGSASGSWEKAGSEGERDWDHVSEHRAVEYCMSEGLQSSQASASSWVHLLDS